MPLDRDQATWLDTWGGRNFALVHGGPEAAKAALGQQQAEENQRVRDAINEYELAYGRRPSVAEIRFRPDVRAPAGSYYEGTSRGWADGHARYDPSLRITVADEAYDASADGVVTGPDGTGAGRTGVREVIGRGPRKW